MDECGGDLICQACFAATERRCSVCAVCVYCSDKCEQNADVTHNARIACAQHLKCQDEEFTGSRYPFSMMPHYPLTRVPSCHKGTQWQTLVFGATHYLEFLIAGSSQTLSDKSVFGLSVVVTGDGKFCAGRQRFSYKLKVKGENLKKRDAVVAMIRNLSQLAQAQLEMTHAPLPSRKSRPKKKAAYNNNNPNNNQDYAHRDYTEDVANQACIVSGIVANEGVHFDAIFLVRSGDKWAVHGLSLIHI